MHSLPLTHLFDVKRQDAIVDEGLRRSIGLDRKDADERCRQ